VPFAEDTIWLEALGRRWYQKLVEILVKCLAFVRSDVDQAVFYHHGGDNSHATIIVVVHIDNCTIAASALSLIVAFKQQIAQHVEITNLDLSRLATPRKH
jgi:hypothetical protein